MWIPEYRAALVRGSIAASLWRAGFEQPLLQLRQLFLDLFIAAGVFGDDRLQMAFEHALGGVERVERMGRRLEAEAPDQLVVSRLGRVFEDGRQHPPIEHAPDIHPVRRFALV